MKARNQGRSRYWLKLILTFLGFLAISIGLGYLIRSFLIGFRIPVHFPAWLALLIIFGVLAVVNLSVLPLPFGVAIMLIASMHWNPVLVALAGSVGASLGEFSSYFFGILGKRIAINEEMAGYKMVRGWIQKYGWWAIALLSFQPILPFELGGFIAGLAKMPVRQFLPAIMLGKFPKYLILIYLGDLVIRFFPHMHVL
jgi:uncharacterized membrane protein YdjX (TVP38/TMEM64 family)